MLTLRHAIRAARADTSLEQSPLPNPICSRDCLVLILTLEVPPPAFVQQLRDRCESGWRLPCLHLRRRTNAVRALFIKLTPISVARRNSAYRR